jgi:hypothetical protein
LESAVRYDDLNVDELYKGRGFTRDFSRCGWSRGEDFVSDEVISILCGSPEGRDTLRLIARNEENHSTKYQISPA